MNREVMEISRNSTNKKWDSSYFNKLKGTFYKKVTGLSCPSSKSGQTPLFSQAVPKDGQCAPGPCPLIFFPL